MNIDLLSLILILSIAQGAFLLITVLLKKPFDRIANRLLLGLLFILLWFQLEFLAIRQAYNLAIPLFYGTRFGSWYIVGPLLYFYTRAYLARPNFEWKKQYYLHFLAFIIITILLPAIAHKYLITWRVAGYGMLTIFDQYNDELSWVQLSYGVLFVGQFMHTFIYSLFSIAFIRKFRKQVKAQLSNYYEQPLQWLNLLHATLLLILVGVAIFVTYLFLTEVYRRQMDYFFVLPFTLFTYLFAFKAVLKPREVIQEKIVLRPNKKYQKSSLSKAHSQKIFRHIQNYMEKERPYLSSDLRLNTLAKALELSPHHLSQAVNENLKLNFYDFINQYRIKAAQELIQKEDHYTLLQVALAVGFNNKNSFNNAFKKHKGMSPSQYKKALVSG